MGNIKCLRKCNTLIHAFQKMDIRVYKVISYGLGKIIDLMETAPENDSALIKSIIAKGYDVRKNLVAIIPRKEMREIVGVSRNYYARLQEIDDWKNIESASTMILRNGSSLNIFSAVPVIEVFDECIYIEYNRELKPILTGDDFTECPVTILRDISDIAAYRLYEILYSCFCDSVKHTKKVCTVSCTYNITELRYLLSYSKLDNDDVNHELCKNEPSYHTVNALENCNSVFIRHFKERALPDAVNIINAWDDSKINVSYTKKGEGYGGTIVSVTFNVCRKPSTKTSDKITEAHTLTPKTAAPAKQDAIAAEGQTELSETTKNKKNRDNTFTPLICVSPEILLSAVRQYIPQTEALIVCPGISDEAITKAITDGYSINEMFEAYSKVITKAQNDEIVSSDKAFIDILVNNR